MATTSAGIYSPAPKRLFGHPPGLTVLFLTQMWAEFSYFGLQALLVYYMTSDLGFSQSKSSLIYGIYGGAAFFSPFFGGIIADKWLGRTPSVVIGGLLMMLGHFAMAFPPFLFPALALVALGNGLFMPPLAVQVGALYADEDPRKAHAFSAYYMGINLGGLLAPLVCGSLGELLGWHWGFGAAGIGMLVGLIVYLGFRQLLPADPGRAAIIPGTAAVPIDARAVRMLVVLVTVVILFRIAYEQSGNVIALWVRDQTDRTLFNGTLTIPATWFQAINPALIILLTPLLIGYWTRKGQEGTAAVLLRRMSLGCIVACASMLVMVAAAIVNGRTGQPVSAWWVLLYFCLLTMGELLVIPVGLTLVNLLSPAGFAATFMGAWYIAKFLGSVLAGVMGSYWGTIAPAMFFGLGAVSVLLAAALLRIMGSFEHRRE
ncbi:peptide MFS transporter [Sphingomonas sp.]|uniref:peptide MFS transporter n=1 Tax=Sphingomonas sp. TaxID=28214 RepID=UPI003B39FBA4